jgi:hypothetical protein
LRALLKSRGIRLRFDLFSTFADELIDRWHNYPKKRAFLRRPVTFPRGKGSEG